MEGRRRGRLRIQGARAGHVVSNNDSMRRLLFVLVLLCVAGCAPHRARLDPTPFITATRDFARADALVRQGCYLCLREALAAYEALMHRPDSAPGAQVRAFDTLLLLAIRERELGRGAGTSLDQARELAERLPAPVETAARLRLVESLPWKASGVTRERIDESYAGWRRVRRDGQGWRTLLTASPESDLTGRYLLLAFDCSHRQTLHDWGLEPAEANADAVPLLRFRGATCDGVDTDGLGSLLADEPRFADARLFLGEAALRSGRLVTAERHVSAALEAIPDLIAARLVLGQVYQAIEDFEFALEAFNAVVAAVPAHREGLLGKAITLSYTGRHPEAIAVLDEMVRLGTWYQGEAFYWRGWNRYRLREFDAANADVAESRKRLPMDPLVDKLTGLIAFAQNDAERAEREFRTAVEHLEGRMTRDCDVEYYLASALVAQRKWVPAAPYFQSALGCYEETEKSVLRRIEEVRQSELGDERKARLIAAKERDIVGMQSQQARAAYNAAVAFINSGDLLQCRPMAERAARHPDFANQAQALLAKLK